MSSRMGRSYAKTCFLSAGNITHDPAYGNLIAMGIVNAVCEHGAGAEHVARAEKYRAMIAETGRFLTFSGGSPPIGHRLRPDPKDRAGCRIVRETDNGLVLSGRIGMHTSPCYAEDIFVGSLNGVQLDGHPVSFVVEVGAKGVTTLCRKIAPRDPNPFLAPLSNRFDELDGTLWLDEVLIPYEHIFLIDPGPEAVARWLMWHHLYGWGARAEFSLGLALALADAMGLKENDATVGYLIDLTAAVQTIRACQTAAVHEPETTPTGFVAPNSRHVMAGGITLFKARQQIGEILRIVPGSSLVVAPSDSDLAAPDLAAGLEEAFAGGGYTATQRAALLQLAWDHASSGLDGRESAFELHASGGMPSFARPAAQELCRLHRAGERGAEAAGLRHAGDRSRFDPRRAARGTPGQRAAPRAGCRENAEMAARRSMRGGAPRRPQNRHHGRRRHRRCDDASGDRGDGRAIRRLVRPAPRPRMGRDASQPVRDALGLCAAADDG